MSALRKDAEELAARIPTRPGRNKRHTPQNVRRALLAIAETGNCQQASEALQRRYSVSVSANTIQRWQNTHRDLFEKLVARHAEAIEEDLVAGTRSTAVEANIAAMHAVMAAKQALDNSDVRLANSAASTAQRLSVVQGIQTDKLLALTGRPSVITSGAKSFEDAVKALQNLGVLAETRPAETSVVDAEIVDDTPQLQPAAQPVPPATTAP